MPPPPPPPPPPLCFPFGSKSKRQLPEHELFSEKSSLLSSHQSQPGSASRPRSMSHTLERRDSEATTVTLTSKDAENLTFITDSENYSNIPALRNRPPRGLLRGMSKKGAMPVMEERVETDKAEKGTKSGSKWGYGWGIGKQKEREMEKEKALQRELSTNTTSTRPPMYRSPTPPTRQSSKSSKNTQSTAGPSGSGSRRPPYSTNDSMSTLVGSAYDRKINEVESIREKVDTSERLSELRKLMKKNELDYYIIPSEDAHQSEYVADSDQRRRYISGFSGSAGQAIVSKTAAYLVTDSRYWLQAQEQLDSNWLLIMAGAIDAPKDWIDFLVDRVKDAKIGIDARMISHEKATILASQLNTKQSKLSYPPQNLVDLIWTDRPSKPRDPIYIHSMEFTGKEARAKIADVRAWITAQPPSIPSYSKAPPNPTQMQVATLITSLSSIAYLLNLRGSDIPYNPIFQAYLFISMDTAVLFADKAKIDGRVSDYLQSLGVQQMEYNDIWKFLRARSWGDGKILLSSQASYAISLMLTHFRYTIASPIVEEMKAVKNEVELDGMRRAYLRDGAAFVRFFAWLETKMSQGFSITEWEAAFKLTELRRKNKYYKGLAYENISASGPNAALPHYSPQKSQARFLDKESPYLNDSGGQYKDGTCDTTRTVHLGRPTPEQCEAYTRVLQGHIAIDSAVFPEGTTGAQLDVLARRALWKDGLNYLHGTGHGFGSFLNVHEGPHSFASSVPLVPGHVITNEPGFYKEGAWGIRIESALAVRRVKTKNEFQGDIWLGFERLTCVPIQTRMVKESMLTKEEKQWLKEHNQRCREKLEPYLREDKVATKWLKREADRGIGIVGPGPGGLTVDWD